MTKLITKLTLNTLLVASGGVLLGEEIVIWGRRLIMKVEETRWSSILTIG